MRVLSVRNVSDALPLGTAMLVRDGQLEDTRAGRVLVMPCPVTTVYEFPVERVIFSRARNANPFFHMVEAVWMLSGGWSAAVLDAYVSDFSRRFAEPGGDKIVHGAYGHRWRKHFDFDQLERAVDLLRSNPRDRQVVIAMWDPVADLGVPDLKDRPCNTHIYFRTRMAGDETDGSWLRTLDMTVCCRSNDAIWGAYGANAVHFSVLMEYIAGHAGMALGRMYQMSNNFHGYVETIEKIMGGQLGDFTASEVVSRLRDHRYDNRAWVPLVPEAMSRDQLVATMHYIQGIQGTGPGWLESNHQPWPRPDSGHPFLTNTAIAATAHRWWRLGGWAQAHRVAEMMTANDWRMACVDWLLKRRGGH